MLNTREVCFRRHLNKVQENQVENNSNFGKGCFYGLILSFILWSLLFAIIFVIIK